MYKKETMMFKKETNKNKKETNVYNTHNLSH